MTEYVWSDTYTAAVHAFDGQTPGRDLEASLIERFEQTPEAVIAAVSKLAGRFQAGKVRSPWPLVLRELDDIDRTAVVADGRLERTNAVRLAHTWIRNAGMHAPLDEALAELFGARGRLEPWRDDPTLRREMVSVWEELQPVYELIEAERLERAGRNDFSDVPARGSLRAAVQAKPDEPTEPQPAVEDDPWPSRLAYEPDLDLEEALT